MDSSKVRKRVTDLRGSGFDDLTIAAVIKTEFGEDAARFMSPPVKENPPINSPDTSVSVGERQVKKSMGRTGWIVTTIAIIALVGFLVFLGQSLGKATDEVHSMNDRWAQEFGYDTSDGNAK